jgi:hypothetical protein
MNDTWPPTVTNGANAQDRREVMMALFGTLHPSSIRTRKKLGGVESADCFFLGGWGVNTQPFPRVQYIGPEDWSEDGP